jgi:hypothetical protein
MKRIVQLSSILILALLLVVGCTNNTKKNEISENKIDLSTQEAYETFLADWGITIPENATLKELKKTNDGNYKLIYNVEPFEDMQDSLQTYYEKMFDAALLDKDWIKPKEGWDPHGTRYEKDDNYFKFFILISEDHNVYELAFKYGQ